MSTDKQDYIIKSPCNFLPIYVPGGNWIRHPFQIVLIELITDIYIVSYFSDVIVYL